MQRALWVTNLPAPYRYRLWEALARCWDLDVRVFAENELNRDWRLDPGRGFSIQLIPNWHVTLGGARYAVAVAPRFLASLRRYDAILLGGWEHPANWLILMVARLLKKRVVGFYESTPASQRYRGKAISTTRRSFFRLCDSVLTVGPESTRAMLLMGIDRDKIVQSDNSIDFALFENLTVGLNTRHPYRFVFVGQLVNRKNPELALRALTDPALADCTLTLAGDGPLASRLMDLVEELGLSTRVTLLGTLAPDGVRDLFAESNCLVLPSTEEVWGMVAVEAAVAGLHVIVSSTVGVAPQLSNEEAVYIIEAVDLDALRVAMRTSLAEWSGRVDRPSLIRFRPESMAQHVIEAMELRR